MKSAFTNWNQVPLVVDMQIACMILNRSYDSLQKSALQGKFPAFRNGERKWAIMKDDLMAWMESQKVKKQGNHEDIA